MTVTDDVLADAERIIDGYRNGRIKQHHLAWELYLGDAYVLLPDEIWAAFTDACTSHAELAKAETGDVNYAEIEPELAHPEIYAEHCRDLLEEALAGLVEAVNAYTANRTRRSAA